MTATRRLYWHDPLLLTFEAEVTQAAALGGRPALVFAETAFYPEAGGQMADRGVARWLDRDGRPVSAAVVDAQADAEGRVLHALELPDGVSPPAVGVAVDVSVDEARRRQHMSLHTGQHMLSRALLDVAGAPTVSSRLGESICTIDTPHGVLSDEALADVEALVGRVVLEDRLVTALYPDPDTLARLPLRRDPKVTESVRVIEIAGFDLSPCGGTHAQRTGQVGPVHVTAVERYKGGLRLSFHAGRRALEDYATKDRAVRALGRRLSCGVDGLVPGVERLEADLVAERREVGALRQRLAAHLAAALVAAAPARADGARIAIAALPGEPVEVLRAVAERAIEARSVVVVTAPAGDTAAIVVQCSAGVGVDAGQVMKRLAQATGGRGGGRPERAEGRLPAGEALEAALQELRGALLAG